MSTAAGRAWYKAYRTTPRWMLLRFVARLLARGRCRRCGGRAREVHHVGYRWVGRPGMALLWELRDLMPLCRRCHAAAHGKER